MNNLLQFSFTEDVHSALIEVEKEISYCCDNTHPRNQR
jgi:hypothetical protein